MSNHETSEKVERRLSGKKGEVGIIYQVQGAFYTFPFIKGFYYGNAQT